MNNITRVFYILCLSAIATAAEAQNWQYVGAPYINANSSVTTYYNFGDLELSSNGDLLMGYSSTGSLLVAKYAAGAWTVLPSAGTFAVSHVDLEVSGSTYYLGHSGVRGSNTYAFVRKYDGTSWSSVGDSVLLGNAGGGGWFELVLDNTGTPFILGGVTGFGSDRKVHKLSGNTWTTVVTIPGSPGTVFRENSGVFNSQNQLLCVSQTLTGAGYTNVVHKIDGTTRTTVGDTVFAGAMNTRLRLDAAGTPHMVFTVMPSSKVVSYKLNGNTWSYTGDTSVVTGAMIGADVTGDGKAVFNTQKPNLSRSVYYFGNGAINNMDSVNVSGFAVASIPDLVVNPATNEVYLLCLEIKSNSAQDYSVVKHNLGAVAAVGELTGSISAHAYPNPASGSLHLRLKEVGNGTRYRICNALGTLLREGPVYGEHTEISLYGLAAGTYLLHITDSKATSSHKILVY